MGSMMIQMKQAVDTTLETAVNKANADYGSPMGTAVSFSNPSELLSQLESLKNEDPEKFSDIMQEISDQLSAAAESEDVDESTSEFLSMLADKFASVTESGDLSELQPPPPPPPQEGTQASQVAQYDSNSGDQQTVMELFLELLSQLASGETTDSTTASASTTSTTSTTDTTDATAALEKVKSLLAQAMQQLAELKNNA